jgi:hypothetical protein
MGWQWRRAAAAIVLAVLVLTPAARTLCALACEGPANMPAAADVATPALQPDGHAHAHAHAHQAPAPRADADRSCAPAPLRPCDPQVAATAVATLRPAADAPLSASTVPPSGALVEARALRAPLPRHRAGPAAGPPRAPVPLRI